MSPIDKTYELHEDHVYQQPSLLNRSLWRPFNSTNGECDDDDEGSANDNEHSGWEAAEVFPRSVSAD